jgi:hypothetical protein
LSPALKAPEGTINQRLPIARHRLKAKLQEGAELVRM